MRHVIAGSAKRRADSGGVDVQGEPPLPKPMEQRD